MSKFVTAKQFFKGFSKAFEGPQHGGKVATIGAVKPNVPKTKKEKLLRDLKITRQKVKGATAKLKQTQFERANPQVKKAKGGRVGLKRGTNPFKKETNVEKIKKTFAPKGLKKIDPQKQKGLAKLKKERPDVVRKMGYFKKGGRS